MLAVERYARTHISDGLRFGHGKHRDILPLQQGWSWPAIQVNKLRTQLWRSCTSISSGQSREIMHGFDLEFVAQPLLVFRVDPVILLQVILSLMHGCHRTFSLLSRFGSRKFPANPLSREPLGAHSGLRELVELEHGAFNIAGNRAGQPIVFEGEDGQACRPGTSGRLPQC
jgi:hypothetical protein